MTVYIGTQRFGSGSRWTLYLSRSIVSWDPRQRVFGRVGVRQYIEYRTPVYAAGGYGVQRNWRNYFESRRLCLRVFLYWWSKDFHVVCAMVDNHGWRKANGFLAFPIYQPSVTLTCRVNRLQCSVLVISNWFRSLMVALACQNISSGGCVGGDMDLRLCVYGGGGTVLTISDLRWGWG